ncbi:hypothetical protein IE53DRAFT_384053 [Violaceomyces palustris]|uniref:Uncharacterized protein n=1 Tax=Violaceomyces palustris TaxID=1673888 RepID=A0ACD0P5W4_9BASI|nr:hypothetical protein IE53DRAFT_384053 [Violaceomyces palustris]
MVTFLMLAVFPIFLFLIHFQSHSLPSLHRIGWGKGVGIAVPRLGHSSRFELGRIMSKF